MAYTGVKAGRFRIRQMMREQGLKAIQLKSSTPRTKDSGGVKSAPNLLTEVRTQECALAKVTFGEIT